MGVVCSSSFMAVKRIANLGAQCVARAETARLDAERVPGGEQSAPNVADGFVRTDDFESVFAGVAGARDEYVVIVKMEAGDLVFLQTGHTVHPQARNRGPRNARINEFLHARALHGHRGVIVRGVGKFEFTGEFCGLRLQPGDIRFDARGVDDEEINPSESW